MFYSDGSSIPAAPYKDPDSVIDYGFNWSGWLASGETISTSVWTTDLTTTTPANNGTITSVMLSGGTAGQSYTLTNRVTTSQGRTEDRSMVITCQDK